MSINTVKTPEQTTGIMDGTAQVPVLEIKNLVKSYKNNAPVLDDVSFSVKKGQAVVVLGPSGCGKSTLLRCVVGLEDIQGGEVILAGQKISGEKHAYVHSGIGMVFQSYDLFPNMNVLKNVSLSPLIAQKRNREEVYAQAEELLRRVGLWDVREAYPSSLSGGQKQRVAIVRALMTNPEVMLFDEITAALDPEMVHEVLEVVMELAKQGRTMIIVTHEMNFARAVADHIVFIDQGKIVEESDDAEKFFSAPTTTRAKEFLKTFEFDKTSRHTISD